MSNIAIINDNDNFAPSIFGHCVNLSAIVLDLSIFSSGATLPQKNTSVQNNNL